MHDALIMSYIFDFETPSFSVIFEHNRSQFKLKMRHIRSSMALATAVIMLVMTGMVAQGQSNNSCTRTFFSSLVQLIPCRAAVVPFSPIPPSETCCNTLKALGQPCLCVLINGPPISGVDRNMAIQLPEKCSANFEPCN